MVSQFALEDVFGQRRTFARVVGLTVASTLCKLCKLCNSLVALRSLQQASLVDIWGRVDLTRLSHVNVAWNLEISLDIVQFSRKI